LKYKSFLASFCQIVERNFNETNTRSQYFSLNRKTRATRLQPNASSPNATATLHRGHTGYASRCLPRGTAMDGAPTMTPARLESVKPQAVSA
jgi:hypothetical protein